MESPFSCWLWEVLTSAHISWWSSQKEKTTPDRTYNKQKVKLEPKRFYHAIRYTFTVKYTHIIPACYDLQINTLGLNLTHSDTYNLVGFSGCLHLWWITLLTPELCVTSVTTIQSPTHRLALNEFQASCYSHHKSHSALSETNWLLRMSGCNLTLNPYQII